MHLSCMAFSSLTWWKQSNSDVWEIASEGIAEEAFEWSWRLTTDMHGTQFNIFIFTDVCVVYSSGTRYVSRQEHPGTFLRWKNISFSLSLAFISTFLEHFISPTISISSKAICHPGHNLEPGPSSVHILLYSAPHTLHRDITRQEASRSRNICRHPNSSIWHLVHGDSFKHRQPRRLQVK